MASPDLGSTPPGAETFAASDQSIPVAADFTLAPDYEARKAQVLSDLRPAVPVSSRQRYEASETHYNDPDREPGIVRFRMDKGVVFDPGLVGEAQTVVDTIEHLSLGGQIKELREEQGEIEERLEEREREGWSGTELVNLGGVGRVLTAIAKPSVKITDPEGFREGMGERFPEVAERRVVFTIPIQEGLQMKDGPMTPELVIELVRKLLERQRINREMQAGGLLGVKEAMLVTDLEVLRELIETDQVPLDTIETDRGLSFTPNVLPPEKSPRSRKGTDDGPVRAD